ncbi:MAG: acetyl-CoA carboxylase biotin carboxyl carrier protein [Chitinophagales bacterium]|nr:acetyl-CoA carboxylase biotin carboxyl carrier protein [Chitinophagales bacterium]
MELKEIQELIKILNKSNISEIRIERDNFKITLRTHDPHGSAPVMATVSTAPSIPIAAPVVAPPVTAPVAEAPKPEAPQAPAADESKYVTIKSPMIGTFYRSSSPDKPPLVNVGDEIKPGSVLCIIEAMKLFNEIESEHSGRIVKVLVENAKPVEYDQPLFLIEPM